MGAFVVAAVAAIGNLLQGWDGGAIAGLNSNPRNYWSSGFSGPSGFPSVVVVGELTQAEDCLVVLTGDVRRCWVRMDRIGLVSVDVSSIVFAAELAHLSW